MGVVRAHIQAIGGRLGNGGYLTLAVPAHSTVNSQRNNMVDVRASVWNQSWLGVSYYLAADLPEGSEAGRSVDRRDRHARGECLLALVNIRRRRGSGGLPPPVNRDNTAACVECRSTKSFDLSLVIFYLAAVCRKGASVCVTEFDNSATFLTWVQTADVCPIKIGVFTIEPHIHAGFLL